MNLSFIKKPKISFQELTRSTSKNKKYLTQSSSNVSSVGDASLAAPASAQVNENVARFVDNRTDAMRKCFIDNGKKDGRQIFQAFLEKKSILNKSSSVHLEETKESCIIDGAHPYKLLWDVLVGILIIYSAIAVPYRLGFALDSSGGWAILDYCVDIIFFIDMVVSFNTSFSNGKEIVRSRRRIAKRYLRTWFIPDFISTFPFDSIVFLTVKSFSSDNLRSFKLVRVLRLFRLLKVFRIIRLNRKLQSAKAGGHINVFVYELLLVMTSVFFMAHFFSCIFYQFVECEPNEANYTSCGHDSAYSQYLLSLSWSLQTILNIGYGNIVLSSSGGRIFSIFAMAGGAVIFGFVLAVMMQAASNKTPIQKEEQHNLAVVGAYLNERSVSHKIKLAIWRHCRFYYSKRAEFDEPSIFLSAPIALRRRFFDAMTSNIRKLNIFEENFTILSRIQLNLQPMRVEPGDSITHQGDYCVDVFFVLHGRVHAFLHSSKTSFRQTFVGEYPEGFDFGLTCSLRVEDASWATYRANEASEILWLDITRLDLDSDIMKVFESAAMNEFRLHKTIEDNISDVSLIDEEAEIYATRSVIYKKNIVSLTDIDGEVIDHKKLQAGGKSDDKIKMYKVFRPVKNDRKNHEIVMESSMDMLKRKIINPSSKPKSLFDGYIAVCTILVIVILPLRMGFSIKPNTAWTIYDIIIEISFIIDIVLSFFTAYEMSDLVLNTDRQHIAARYLKGWFVIDMVSGLPVTMLTLNEGFLLLRLFKFARIIRLVRVMRVFRITRLLKIMKISSRYEEKPFSTLEETYVKFIRLSLIVLIFTHITACFWSKLAVDRKGSDTWEDAINIEESSLWRRYLASFYFVYVTMNTTGYGDILAQNDVERFVLLFIIVLGSFLVAHVVAEISETNTGLDCNTGRLYLLRSYLQNKQIPEIIQTSMLRQVSYSNTIRTTYSEVEIWRKLPFKIRVELAVVCHNTIISQFPNVFDTKSPPIVFILLNYFEPVFIVQGGYAFTFETGSGGLYLISSGSVQVVDEDESGKELIVGEHRAGRLFGSECIDNEMLTYLGVRAKEQTSCYRLSVSAIAYLYKEHPSVASRFFENIKAKYKGTREDASIPINKKPAAPSPPDSSVMSSVGMQKVISRLKALIWGEEKTIDSGSIYFRTNLNSGKWSPYMKNKLEAYIEANSPSLILSDESWKLFVATKDPQVTVEEEDSESVEEKESDEDGRQKSSIDSYDVFSTETDDFYYSKPPRRDHHMSSGRSMLDSQKIESFSEIDK